MRRKTQKNIFVISKITLILSVLILMTACGAPETPIESAPEFQNAVNTSVANTMVAEELNAQRTKGAEAGSTTETVVPDPTETVEVTETPELTDTPVPTSTISPTSTLQPTVPLDEAPSVEVSLDTNCRSGPGKVYNYLGGLLVGDVETVVAKDPTGQYWYITNPDKSGEYCWVWGEYATITGNSDILPVYTPGPTPSPLAEFVAQYREVETCKDAWQVEFSIENTGRILLESIETTVEDTVTNEIVSKLRTNFKAKDGCQDQFKVDRLKVDESGYTTSADLSEDPTGNLLYVTMKACSTDTQDGECREFSFYITP